MISHTLDRGQVEQVLGQVEAVTRAVRGIEAKAGKAHTYFTAVQGQREELTRQAEKATSIIDNLSDKLNKRSDKTLTFFRESLETVADLVEHLETTLFELNIQDVPRQIQREFGPLVVPAVVVVLVVTVSNCIFGFILAGDEALAESFSLNVFQRIETADDAASQGGHRLDILNVFAIFHVCLIGSAALFLVIELSRKLGCSMCRNRRSTREVAGGAFAHSDSFDDAAAEDQEESIDSAEFETNDLVAELERRNRASEHGRPSAPAGAASRAAEEAPPSRTPERPPAGSPRGEISGELGRPWQAQAPSFNSAWSTGSSAPKKPISGMLRRFQSVTEPLVERITTTATASQQRSLDRRQRDGSEESSSNVQGTTRC